MFGRGEVLELMWCSPKIGERIIRNKKKNYLELFRGAMEVFEMAKSTQFTPNIINNNRNDLLSYSQTQEQNKRVRYE